MSAESLNNPPPSGSPAPPPSGRRERDLIEAALGRAESPRAGSGSWVGDMPPAATFPGYELIREIHRGGQGAVYLAIQKATRRKVAVKVMHGGPFAGSSGKARFEREIQVLGQLSHPNIVRIHDSGLTPDGSVFYVMDYISGRSLEEFISAEKRPPVEETLRLFGKICEAVNAAHLRGVIHRDLKPANIRVDNSGEPIVVDFGLAKTAVPNVTEESRPRLMSMTGQFIGSLPWASPEQAQGSPDNVDLRTDVYSLGVILYQLLTGKFPYEVVGNMRDVLDNILRAEPAKPSTIRRQINDEVETIVLKCLTKERERRYQSAGELGRDIQRYLGGEPIEAKRDSGWYFVSKMARRYRTPVTLGVAFVVLLAAFAVGMTALYAQAQAARSEEAVQRRVAEDKEKEARAQRDLAVANFEAVRSLAKVFMGEFNQQIANLVGATAARKTILREAQGYLTHLKPQASEDPAYLRDVALANEQIGDLLGGLYLRKVGDTAGAAVYYGEALRLRQQVAVLLPNEARSHADLGRSIGRDAGMMMLAKRDSEARARCGEAVAEFDRAVSLAGRGTAEDRSYRDDRARAVASMAEAMFRMAAAAQDPAAARAVQDEALARSAEAAAYWKAVLNADPAKPDPVAARELCIVHDQRVALLIQVGTVTRQAASALARDGKKEEAIKRFDEALARLEEARAAAEACRAEVDGLSGANAADGALRRDVLLIRHNVGLVHQEVATALDHSVRQAGAAAERTGEAAKRRETAVDVYRGAVVIAEELASADRSSLEAQRDLALLLNKVGRVLIELDRFDEASEPLRRSAEIREVLVKSDPLERHTRDLGQAYVKRGDLAHARADSAAGGERTALLEESLAWLQKAMGLFQQLRESGVDNARDIDALGRTIDSVNEKLGRGGGG